MRTAEEQFRQANDPNGGGGMDMSSTAFAGRADMGIDDSEAGGGGVGGLDAEAGGGGSGGTGGEEGGGGRRGRRRNRASSVMRPTILMRESSTLFRRASESLCRRLGEADGSTLMDPDVSGFEVSGGLIGGCPGFVRGDMTRDKAGRVLERLVQG